MQSWIQNRWTGLCLLVMAFGALMLFLYGFFPLKYNSGKLAHMDDLPNKVNDISVDGQVIYNSGENSVVLMVIDGLRHDFVTDEFMPFTGQLLKNKSACIYVSVAEPPTVTMPRIKAMMTGSVSTFADVALNFGAPAVKGDSVLRVAASRGRRSVMYGDDTWLRLFPDLWAEYDGTTSFYVSDYTEVDNNVTRHLDKILAPDEKKKPTFDFLVLHYLGLDHIGHLEGARSKMIQPKLLEMDEVVKKIYTAMQSWDRNGVLLICGDHGMRDAGGHGGSTPAEVLVPLVALKSTDFVCPYTASSGPTVAQVDLAPTIAWLLNAPIPGDSTGRMLPSLLPLDMLQHLYLLHVVASHNTRLPGLPTNKAFYKEFESAQDHFSRFLMNKQDSAAKLAKQAYEQCLDEMAKYLAETNVDFDVYALGVGVALLYFITASLLCVLLYSLQPSNRRKVSTHVHKPQAGAIVAFIIVLITIIITLTLSCFITETKSQLCSFDELWLAIFLLIGCCFTMTYFITKSGIEKIVDLTSLKELNIIDYFLVLATLFHAWSFFGTSFIEEEHMTWYFFWNILMFFVLVRTIVVMVVYLSKKCGGATEVQEKPLLERRMQEVGVSVLPQWILLIALHRYLKTMNQTGDRWLMLPDTADWLNSPENEYYLQAHLVIGTIVTFAVCLWNLRHTNNTMKLQTILTTLAVTCIIFYRVATNSLDAPFSTTDNWDAVTIVNIFWALLIAQFTIEILSFTGLFKGHNRFNYTKPKAKREDYFYDSMDDVWNIDEVKLSLARSLSYLMWNSIMLIVILLMRPHNVIMVPSVYFTCVLTAKCLDHKLLDTKSRDTDVVDTIALSLAHLWIGSVFFFYQGNSNSLASVDLGSGYVGLREYCPLRVAARMGLHAYAGHALAGCSLFCHLATTDTWQRYLQSVWRASNVFALQRVYQLVIYCIISIVFRHHLFVWTVFSPKLLYDFVGTVFTIQALFTIAQIVMITHVVSWLARILTYKSKM